MCGCVRRVFGQIGGLFRVEEMIMKQALVLYSTVVASYSCTVGNSIEQKIISHKDRNESTAQRKNKLPLVVCHSVGIYMQSDLENRQKNCFAYRPFGVTN